MGIQAILSAATEATRLESHYKWETLSWAASLLVGSLGALSGAPEAIPESLCTDIFSYIVHWKHTYFRQACFDYRVLCHIPRHYPVVHCHILHTYNCSYCISDH